MLSYFAGSEARSSLSPELVVAPVEGQLVLSFAGAEHPSGSQPQLRGEKQGLYGHSRIEVLVWVTIFSMVQPREPTRLLCH